MVDAEEDEEGEGAGPAALPSTSESISEGKLISAPREEDEEDEWEGPEASSSS